jgi:hypothetical protein
MTSHSFAFIDSVVLYAIAWAGPKGADPEVLEPCFEHLDALPTILELNTAISRLVAAELVRVEAHRVFAGPQATALFESVVHLPARTIPAHFERLLSTVPFRSVATQEYFSQEELRTAQKNHERRLREAMRKLGL